MILRSGYEEFGRPIDVPVDRTHIGTTYSELIFERIKQNIEASQMCYTLCDKVKVMHCGNIFNIKSMHFIWDKIVLEVELGYCEETNSVNGIQFFEFLGRHIGKRPDIIAVDAYYLTFKIEDIDM